ncbi:hypothetical protein JVU11DRAFT_4484 [Chiua virens]|nr:hypothetical protein JVU11DRAFT_4484 [Chiua virens]
MSPHSQFVSSSFTSQYQAQGQLGPQPTGTGAFQPTNGFAQPPQQYPIQSNYPYPGGGYPQQQPPTNITPDYLTEFDPYAQQSHGQQPQLPAQGTSGNTGPPNTTHPRDLIRVHKSGLEMWDVYSWKQLLGGCEALKEAWAARKQQAESVVRQYGGPDPGLGYNNQVEGWRQVLKDANNNFDTVAACTFQLQEVFNSYRQSGDAASKRRVRESCNAAVKGLPDWPSN